jgi:hypothetical protein
MCVFDSDEPNGLSICLLSVFLRRPPLWNGPCPPLL